MVGGNALHVAGIIDQDEADMLLECGFNHLGFPFRLAKNKEDLAEEDAARIIRSLPADVTAFLITYLADPDQVIALCKTLGVSYVQIHSDVPQERLATLKAAWPELTVIKSLVVRADNLAALEQQIESTSSYVDGYITDTFDPATGATGATGKTHDWNVSRRLVEISPCPVIVAGGLNADNVGNAIRQTRPAGVDVHTGIEGSDGRKDRDLTCRFVAEAQAAFRQLV